MSDDMITVTQMFNIHCFN